MKDALIVALDVPSGEEAIALLNRFPEEIFVKVGMELFYREGTGIVRQIKDRGHRVFLDLKLHDIPNTVQRAMRNLAGMDVDMVNLHAAGGMKMMKAARDGLDEGSGNRNARPICIAVTQLTSTDQKMLEEELWIHEPVAEVAAHYGEMAKEAGLDGVVCSVHEVRQIHARCGEGFLTVTPGIRPTGAAQNDQARVATPAYARQQGSDYIVVGRPVTQAPDPWQAYQQIRAEWEGGTGA